MKKILLLCFLGIIISSCSDDKETQMKIVSMKIDGIYRAYTIIDVSESTYFELIPYEPPHNATTRVTAYFDSEDFEDSEAFHFEIVKEGVLKNKIVLSAYVDINQQYNPNDENYLTFETTTNNNHSLITKFSGTLKGDDGQIISITEGEISLKF